jgi:hypothetical protein
MRGWIDWRDQREQVKLAQRILVASFNTLSAERLRATQPLRRGIRTAWPEMFVEFSDLVSGLAVDKRRYYTADEIRHADAVCDIFSRLPYSRDQKKMALTKARSHPTWRELATAFRVSPWQDCRAQCVTVYLHLIQVAAADPTRLTAYANRWPR